jgi:hypothetical protein
MILAPVFGYVRCNKLQRGNEKLSYMSIPHIIDEDFHPQTETVPQYQRVS